MILTTIMIIMISRYKKTHPGVVSAWCRRAAWAGKVLLLLVCAFILMGEAAAQEKRLSYSVKRSNSEVGTMNVVEIRNGSKVRLKLQLDVEFRMVFNFTARGIEESVYDGGLLVYSYVYQKVNGTEKVNKRLNYVDKTYVVNNKGAEEKLNTTQIHFNMVCMYTNEPVQNKWIYSDKYEKYLPIKKIRDRQYRIGFPDGNYSDYFYENGICQKIEVNNSMFTIHMELKK